MKNKLYVNNFSGVNAPDLKDSVYLLRDQLDPKADVLEEKRFEEDENLQMKNYNTVYDICRRYRTRALQVLANNDIPIMIAGDHSIGMGSVSATAAYYDNVGVVWVDAHADINTEKTSPSGNLHGMTIASLLGLGSTQLNLISGQEVILKPQNILYLGLRDLDQGEVDLLNKYSIKAYYYEDIATRGLASIFTEIKADWKFSNLHLSFDFDSIDPELMPGVSVPVSRGFSEDEALSILNFFKTEFKCRSVDFVEFNAGRDIGHKSLKTCLKLINAI